MKTLCSFVSLAALGSLAWAQPALTIYNQDFAVVRERIPLELKEGATAAAFAGVTLRLEPDSVVLRDAAGKVPLRILEQSYRADTLSSGFLLSLHEGKELDFLVRDQNAKEYTVRGKVIRSGYAPGGESADAPIIEIDGKLRFSLPGEPIFPALSDAGVLKPTLTWQLASDRAAKIEAELGYITGGMSWQAAYNLIAPEKGDMIDIVGWVTVANRTGKTFENATIKLMAGNVHKIAPEDAYQRRKGAEMTMQAFAVADAAVTEKAFDEFHLYSLPRATTLRDRETKQVEFMRGTGVKALTVFVFDGARAISPMSRRGGAGGTKVAIMREFENTEKNGLGLPLPQGRTRFYRRDDADGRLEFVGENTIEHTARGETVRIYTGDAFDLVGERKVAQRQSSTRQDQREENVEVTLRNRKSEPVEIRVVEHLAYGLNWTILEKSDAFTKKDAQTIEFRIPLKPDEERTVTYRVRYDWK